MKARMFLLIVAIMAVAAIAVRAQEVTFGDSATGYIVHAVSEGGVTENSDGTYTITVVSAPAFMTSVVNDEGFFSGNYSAKSFIGDWNFVPEVMDGEVLELPVRLQYEVVDGSDKFFIYLDGVASAPVYNEADSSATYTVALTNLIRTDKPTKSVSDSLLESFTDGSLIFQLDAAALTALTEAGAGGQNRVAGVQSTCTTRC